MNPLAGKGTCCLLPTATKHFDRAGDSQQKIPLPPQWKVIENSERGEDFEGKYKAKLEFPEGWGKFNKEAFLIIPYPLS